MCTYSVLNMKVLVGAFKQEKACSRGLLPDYEPSCGPSFEALVSSVSGASAGCFNGHENWDDSNYHRSVHR